MLINLDIDSGASDQIKQLIGDRIDVTKKIASKQYGSNLYRLKDSSLDYMPRDGKLSDYTRINFEMFENGILLRINDNQKLFGHPLNNSSVRKILLKQGEERVVWFSLTHILLLFRVKKQTIKKYWLLPRGFYNEAAELQLELDNGYILLTTNGNNFKAEKQFFEKSVLKEKLVVETQ